MKIRYTVYKKHCPHCNHTLYKYDDSAKSLISCLWILALPALIPYWIIKYLGFGNPSIPKIGPKTITCPCCSLPVRTDNSAIEDLSAKGLLIYRFKERFTISYVLGAVFGFSVLFHLADSKFATECGFISLLSILGAVVIIIVYRVKLRAIK